MTLVGQYYLFSLTILVVRRATGAPKLYSIVKYFKSCIIEDILNPIPPLPPSDKSKLVDPFKLLEHQEGDLKKKKEAEPILVRLQKISESRHLDDYALNKSLRARLRDQKKRVAEEEASSRKAGFGIRLLPVSKEDATSASRVKFAKKFEKNRKEKRALIQSASIFSGSLSTSVSDKRRLELEAKRRKINASTASKLLVGGIKPSSWARSSVPSRKSIRS